MCLEAVLSIGFLVADYWSNHGSMPKLFLAMRSYSSMNAREISDPGPCSRKKSGREFSSTQQKGLAASTRLTRTGTGGVSSEVCTRMTSIGRPLGSSLPVIAPDGFAKVIWTRLPVEDRPGSAQSPSSTKCPSSSTWTVSTMTDLVFVLYTLTWT